MNFELSQMPDAQWSFVMLWWYVFGISANTENLYVIDIIHFKTSCFHNYLQ
jgi:hypothetical protein